MELPSHRDISNKKRLIEESGLLTLHDWIREQEAVSEMGKEKLKVAEKKMQRSWMGIWTR